jgi:hypothetical protein
MASAPLRRKLVTMFQPIRPPVRSGESGEGF